MTNFKTLKLVFALTVGIYIILTSPLLLSIMTYDIDTGHYYGFRYPNWFIYTIGFVSAISGNILARSKYFKQ
jgi:hypothetical protein